MAKTFLTSINLNRNELQNAVAHALAGTEPGTPVEGQFFYDSTAKEYKIHNGTSFIDITGSVTSISTTTEGVTIAGTSKVPTVDVAQATTGADGLMSSEDKTILDNASTTAVSTLVLRDASGDFTANDITANKVTGLIAPVDGTDAANKDYVLANVSSSVTFQGGYNATTDTPVLDTTSTNIAISKGDMYVVETAGPFFSVDVEVGDVLIAEEDMAVTSADPAEAKWTIVNKNLDDASIKVAYENNAETNAYTDAELAKVGFITVTQAVDLDTMESDIATNNGKVTNVDTDLSLGTQTATTLDVNSSDGTNATLPLATSAGGTNLAGLLSGTQVDAITANTAKVTNVDTDLGYTASATDGTVTSSDGTDATVPLATSAGGTNLAGLMTPAQFDINADAVLNADTDASAMSFVIDEDAMGSNSATKVPTQQSVVAYVTSEVGAGLGRYTAGVGNGALTTVPVNHALGNLFVNVQVYKTASPYNLIECDVNLTDTNNLDLVFTVAPAASEYTVVVIG